MAGCVEPGYIEPGYIGRVEQRVAAERGRAGDPERRTALLWDRQPTERARPALSVQRIVAAAVDLADVDGLAALSMRRLAERLGFTSMALYRYVPGRAELIDLMCEQVMSEVTHPSAGSEGWRPGLEAWARAGRALRQRHPWLTAALAERRVPGPRTVENYEHALGVMATSDLPAAQVIAAVGLVGGFVESAARQDVEIAHRESTSGEPDREWWGARDSLFDKLDVFPTLSSLWEAGGFDAPEDPFEFGLARVLDGIEVLVHSRAR